MIIVVNENQQQRWEHSGEPVKLWELYPCEDYSKLPERTMDAILRYRFGVGLHTAKWVEE